jgi:hypothetical protein
MELFELLIGAILLTIAVIYTEKTVDHYKINYELNVQHLICALISWGYAIPYVILMKIEYSTVAIFQEIFMCMIIHGVYGLIIILYKIWRFKKK